MLAVACAVAFCATSCSSSEDDPTPAPKDPEVTYKGNVAYSDGLVFNGTELGNGTQNFHLTGDERRLNAKREAIKSSLFPVTPEKPRYIVVTK